MALPQDRSSAAPPSDALVVLGSPAISHIRGVSSALCTCALPGQLDVQLWSGAR